MEQLLRLRVTTQPQRRRAHLITTSQMEWMRTPSTIFSKPYDTLTVHERVPDEKIQQLYDTKCGAVALLFDQLSCEIYFHRINRTIGDTVCSSPLRKPLLQDKRITSVTNYRVAPLTSL